MEQDSNFPVECITGFTGDCLVQLEDSTTEYVKNLQKGDRLWGGHVIEDIVKTPVHKEVEMVLFNTGLHITPYHPIKTEPTAEWCFPCHKDYILKLYVEEYYNIVVNTTDVANINGIYVATHRTS
jgi:hypothetical protein